MEVRRTAPVKLVVPDEYHDDLHETGDQFLYCANEASDYCWENSDYEDCITSNVKARDALYDRLRKKTDLTANLVQEAIRRAVHAVESGIDRWKKGKRTDKPEFTSWSLVYDNRSATFYRNKISLSTVNGRIECEFELPADSPTPYEEYVLSDDYEFRTSTLQYDQAADEFYFHLKTRKVDDEGEAVEVEVSDDTGHQTVLGIDLGVNSLAVDSTGTFWSGDEYDHFVRSSTKCSRPRVSARSERISSGGT